MLAGRAPDSRLTAAGTLKLGDFHLGHLQGRADSGSYGHDWQGCGSTIHWTAAALRCALMREMRESCDSPLCDKRLVAAHSSPCGSSTAYVHGERLARRPWLASAGLTAQAMPGLEKPRAESEPRELLRRLLSAVLASLGLAAAAGFVASDSSSESATSPSARRLQIQPKRHGVGPGGGKPQPTVGTMCARSSGHQKEEEE